MKLELVRRIKNMVINPCKPWPETDKAGKELSQPQKDLWCAAQLIRKGGLCKSMVEYNGSFCWVGAISKVTTETSMGFHRDDQDKDSRFGKARDHWTKVTGWDPCRSVVWNNRPETTGEDVAGKLEEAAVTPVSG